MIFKNFNVIRKKIMKEKFKKSLREEEKEGKKAQISVSGILKRKL